MSKPIVTLPDSLDLLELEQDALERLFSWQGRFSRELMYRSAMVHLVRRVSAGLESRPRRNLRSLFYTFGRPLSVAAGRPPAGAYTAFLRALADLEQEGTLDYVSLGLTDELWENRRIGERWPGVVLISEKDGQIRLLRTVHDRADVTIQAFRGNPSAVTNSYLAAHVRERLRPGDPRALLALVDWDPFGHLIAQTAAAQLKRHGLDLGPPRLLLTPEHFTAHEISLHGYVPRVAPKHQSLAARWLATTGGINGELRGLAIDALPRERLLHLILQAVDETL